MKLVKLSCTNCGASLEVNEELKNVHCNYCGQNFLIDDNLIKVEVDSSKNEIENAKTYLNSFKEYNKAYSMFIELSEKYANNSIIWLGLLRSYSKDFNEAEFANININEIKDYYKKYISTEKNKGNKKVIEGKYLDYIKKYDKYNAEIEKRKEEDKNAILMVIIIVSIILCSSKLYLNNLKTDEYTEPIDKFDFEIKSDKSIININEKLQFTANILKTNYESENYDIIWDVSDDYIKNNGATISEKGVFSSKTVGEFDVCGTMKNKKKCKTIKVEKPCEDTYVFKFDGTNKTYYNVGDKNDVCPGTYKMKIDCIDDSRCGFVAIHHGFEDHEYLRTDWLSDWTKFAVKSGDSIEVDSGIEKITIKKIK